MDEFFLSAQHIVKRFANHTAALTVSRLGAMPSLPTLAEVAATMPGGVSGLEG